MRFMTLVIGVLLWNLQLFAQSAENLLVIVNETSPVSLEIGSYYAEKRGVPREQILRLRTPSEETIQRPAYERQIEAPIASWISRNSAHDRILYIVLTKGIPLRIGGTTGENGTIASVDSELALLYRKMTGQSVSPSGRIANPYFLAAAPVIEAKQFSHERMDIFLVTRLDGYASEDVRGLIDRALAPSSEGKILLDGKGAAQDKGELWLKAAADALQANGFGERVVFDDTPRVLTDLGNVLGYYSWGSSDPANKLRRLGLRFVPGGLSALFAGSDARTFSEPPADWKIGTWEDKSSHFAGSPQSLSGDLIREGVTGVAGHVAEPYLEATIRPNTLFPAYLAGFNLAESYYLAMPFLSWQTVVIGDPLCAPFRSGSLSSSEIDGGIDETTELPKFFSERRLRNVSVAAYQQSKVHPDTVRILLRAEARLARQDQAEARRLLEEATSRDSRLASAQLTLALLYEQGGDHDKAIERYRRVLEMHPDSALVLNNLAYSLAVRKNSPKEALPLAERAYGLARGNPNITDTLGWIHHLAGDDAKALIYLEEALRGAGSNAEILFHAASVYAATGRMDKAAEALGQALTLDPKLADREEVKLLQSRLNRR